MNDGLTTIVRFKLEQIQLLSGKSVVFVRHSPERLLLQRGYLEQRGRAQPQQVVQRRRKPYAFLNDRDDHVDRRGDSDLRLHHVFGGAVDLLSAQMLLNPANENSTCQRAS